MSLHYRADDGRHDDRIYENIVENATFSTMFSHENAVGVILKKIHIRRVWLTVGRAGLRSPLLKALRCGSARHGDVTSIDTLLTSKPSHCACAAWLDVRLKDDDDGDHSRSRRGNSSRLRWSNTPGRRVDKWFAARREAVAAKDRKSHVVTWSKSITRGPVPGGLTAWHQCHCHDAIYCVKPHLACSSVV